jgi:hypothetical protein
MFNFPFSLLLLVIVGRSSAFLPFSLHPSSTTRSSSSEQHQHFSTPLADWDREKLTEYCTARGITLTFSTLGPGYRALARSSHNETQILGYVEGIVRGNLLHMDKMEVFAPIVKRAREENERFVGGGTILGLGVLRLPLPFAWTRIGM